MSRMASFRSLNQPVAARWVLLILIGCLAMHFLIEDALLLSASVSTNPKFGEQQRYEEATHQDDLAAPIRLPERITNGDLLAGLAVTMPSPRQASSPIFPPPKIA